MLLVFLYKILAINILLQIFLLHRFQLLYDLNIF